MKHKISFQNALLLAPLAGFTDAAQRQISSLQGADWCYTEMVSAKGLLYGNEKTEDLLLTPPAQKIRAVQLFGSEPKVFHEVLANLKALEPFEIVDINMGCPVLKIVRSGEGSALSKDIRRAGEIVLACVRAAKGRLITAKIRSGWDAGSVNAVEMAKVLEDNGAAAVTVHARTREQFYTGECDYGLVARVRAAVKIPVIVSGGIVDEESCDRIRAETGCNAVMIGRGALGTNIFARLALKRQLLSLPPSDCRTTSLVSRGQSLATTKSKYSSPYGQKICDFLSQDGPRDPSLSAKHKLFYSLPPLDTAICTAHKHSDMTQKGMKGDNIWDARREFLNHLSLMKEYYGEKYAVNNIRKFGAYYLKNIPNTRELRNAINTARSTAEIEEMMGDIIST